MRHGIERGPTVSPVIGPVLDRILSARCASAVPADLAPRAIRVALEAGVRAEVPRAMVLLGRIHAGLDEELRRCAGVAGRHKTAYAASLFLRAAELGFPEGWLALAEYYACRPDRPMAILMARHFLERAAEQGSDAARLRLGRLLLDAPMDATDAERGVALLQPLALRGEREALIDLSRLVPRRGSDAALARRAIRAVACRQPLLSVRLELALVFGLRQYEALTVDVEGACRPWGLLVDTRAFFRQACKRVQRALPAIDYEACDTLDRAVRVFRRHGRCAIDDEGPYRRRVYRLRQALAREGVEEAQFFTRPCNRNVAVTAP